MTHSAGSPIDRTRAERGVRSFARPGNAVLLAAVVTTGVALYDWLAVPALAGMLLVGPCLAAISASVRGVLGVGVYAGALMLLLAPVDHIWFHAHLVLYGLGLIAITLIGAAIAYRIGVQERARSIAERQFHDTFEQSPVGIMLVSVDPGSAGRILRVNEAITRLTRIPAPMLLSMNVAALVNPDERADQQQVLAALSGTTSGPVALERVWHRPDGTSIQVRATVNVVQTADRDHEYLVVVAEDITDRRAAIAELASSQELLQRVGEIAQVGGWSYEVATDKISWTPEVSRLYDLAEHLPNPTIEQWIALLPPEIEPTVRGIVASAGSNTDPWDLEVPLTTATGRSIWVRAICRPVVEDGRVVRLFGALQDITERKLAEAAVAREATLELARTEAERANNAKSEFLSRMSHELRTPLNAILGFGQLLQMDELSESQRSDVDHITKAGRHLLELIDEVLDISRIESGQLALSLEPVRLDEVIDEAVSMIRPLTSGDELRLLLPAVPVDCWVRGDRQRLRQALLNLLSNAVKYNRPGGDVGVEVRKMDDGRCRVLISDTGRGVAPGDLERMFAPFERLGAERSEVQGTGLGLALTKHLIEAMGGAIGVRSDPGAGSTFWIDLLTADAPVTAPELAAPARAGRGRSSLTNRSVLYIEDNPSNMMLLESVINRRPEFSLLTAMQGSIGLDLAREHQPDIILLDLHMPDMSGEEVLRRLQSDPRTAAIPVVVVSADATPGQLQRLQKQGAAEYLTKPIDVHRLLTVLDERALRADPAERI